MLRHIRCLVACISLFSIANIALAQTPMVSWLTRSFDNNRSGWNPRESRLTQGLIVSKGIFRATTITLVGDRRGMEAQPLVLPAVATARGLRDVMVLPSMADVVRGVDAHDGSGIWQTTLGVPVTKPPPPWEPDFDMHNINEHWGCISTGVIDPDMRRLYQVCWVSPNKSGNPLTARYYMFVLSVADGSFVTPPVMITGIDNGQDFNAGVRKQRSSLVEINRAGVKTVIGCSGPAIENGVGAGFCFAFDVASNKMSAMLAMSPARLAGVWMAGQGPAADAHGDLIVATGNGDFNGVDAWGESLLKLHYAPAAGATPASLRVTDHWTPFTDAARPGSDVGNDQDFGSAGPACIMALNVCIAAGKDGIGYPVKMDHMGGTTIADLRDPKANCAKLAAPPVWLTMSPGPVDPCPLDPKTLNFYPGGDSAHLHMTPVQFFDPVLKSWTLFVWGENAQLHKWAVSPTGALTYIAQSHEYASEAVRQNAPGGMPGGFCSGSSNGADPNSALLVCTIPYGNATMDQNDAGRLLVYDPVHLASDGSLRVLWDSQQEGIQFQFNKFDPPIIDGGQIYVPNYQGGVDVYDLVH